MNLQTVNLVEQVVKLERKLDSFLHESGESLTLQEKQRVIDSLLNGRYLDLSGVTAIRGFVYQYYVAVKYLVDMLFSKSAWWDRVIFELLDDIALHGDNKIRFVQVKTKSDSNISNNLTLSDIYNRPKQKGSWLDKLFLLNVHIFCIEQKKLIRDDAFIDQHVLEFELVTNSQYNQDIAIYARDDNFLPQRSEDDYKDLLTHMAQKPLNWEVSYQGSQFTINTDNYNHQVRNAKWYLDRFRIQRYGVLEVLRETTIKSIMSNTQGNRDSFHEYKAGLVFDMVLQEILKKTCQDRDGVDLNSFVFEKETFQKQLFEWIAVADDIASEASTRNSLNEKFTNCFDQIRRDIDGDNWKPNLRQQLLVTLTNLQEHFANQIRNQSDVFVYQRFLQRLFYRINSDRRVPLNDLSDDTRIYGALKYLVYCLVFYRDVSYSPKEADLLLKRGFEDIDKWKGFSIYNAREKEDLEVAKKVVRTSALNCSISQSMNHDFHCFIADYKETVKKQTSRRQRTIDSVHTSITDPSMNVEAQENNDLKNQGIEITRQTENIKFYPVEFVKHHFLYLLNDTPPVHSFLEEEVVEEWHGELFTKHADFKEKQS